MIALEASAQDRLIALQEALVPRYAGLSTTGKETSAAMINSVLGRQEPDAIRKLRLFLRLIDIFSWRFGRLQFSSLSTDKKNILLSGLFNSRFVIIRAGITSLNTLCKLGVYAQTQTYAEIGYRQRPVNGNTAGTTR